MGLSATFVLAACDTGIHFPGSGGADAQVSASCLEAEAHADFEFLREQVFPLSCANFTSCHQGQRPASSLDLTRARAFAQLVGAPAISVAGWTRVVPGDPEASYLLVKLGAVDGPLGERGTFMPPGGVPLCTGKVGAVRRWIEAGAPGPADAPDAAAPDAAPADALADARVDDLDAPNGE
jgi:hypothetical protein